MNNYHFICMTPNNHETLKVIIKLLCIAHSGYVTPNFIRHKASFKLERTCTSIAGKGASTPPASSGCRVVIL